MKQKAYFIINRILSDGRIILSLIKLFIFLATDKGIQHFMV